MIPKHSILQKPQCARLDQGKSGPPISPSCCANWPSTVHTADPPYLAVAGSDMTTAEASVHNPRVAATYLGYMGALFVGATAVHAALVYAWITIPFTAAKPLPAFLLMPGAQVLLLNLLSMPAGMYGMLLMVQAPSPAQRFLGAVVFLLVLAYLSWLTNLLLYVVRNKRALGLCNDTEIATDSESPLSSDAAPATFYDRTLKFMSGITRQTAGPSHSTNNSRTLLMPDTPVSPASSSQASTAASSSTYNMPMAMLSIPGVASTPTHLVKPAGASKGDMSIVIDDTKDAGSISTASKSYGKGTTSGKSSSWSMGAHSKKELQSLHGGGQWHCCVSGCLVMTWSGVRITSMPCVSNSGCPLKMPYCRHTLNLCVLHINAWSICGTTRWSPP